MLQLMSACLPAPVACGPASTRTRHGGPGKTLLACLARRSGLPPAGFQVFNSLRRHLPTYSTVLAKWCIPVPESVHLLQGTVTATAPSSQ